MPGAQVVSPAESTASGIARAYPGLDLAAQEIAGEPAEVVAEVGQGVDMLVRGTRGTGGFDGLRLGSAALGAAGRAPCSVVLVATPGLANARKPEVVVGVDARHPDERALDLAFEAAGVRGVRLRAVHAWNVPARHSGGSFGVA